MTDVLHIDIETRSRVDLRKSNVYRYVEDPDFRILMAGWSFNGSPVRVAVGKEEILEIPGLWEPGIKKVAHNAAFERICFSALAWDDPGAFSEVFQWEGSPYLPPEEWHDTASIAAEWGYPASLDGAARALRLAQKDSAGTRLINLFSKPNRKGGWNDETTHPDEWMEFIDYCRQDVEVLIALDKALPHWPTSMEWAVYVADQHINDNGILIDVEMAEVAQDAAENNRIAQELEVMSMTGVSNPGSVQQMMKWAANEGLGDLLPNMQAETLKTALKARYLTEEQRRVLVLRQELALAAASKYTAALNSTCRDGRLRGSFRFFGAHTGRWAGRGLQPQNLPRASLSLPDWAKEIVDQAPDKDEAKRVLTGQIVDSTIFDLKMTGEADPHTLKALVRSLFVGPYTVVDYAAIEARVLAWLAGEAWALQAFRDGRDIYVETAERMGGLTRAQGKIAVLALGYNGGVNSLKAMGGAMTFYNPKTGKAVKAGSPAALSGNLPMREMTDEEYQQLVTQWRTANGKIVRLWADLQEAFADGGRCGPKLRVVKRGDDRELVLPSGRGIHYHGVRWERFRMADPRTGRSKMKEGFRYNDPKGPGRIPTYGGRLAENATQAVARDLMAEALVRLREAGHTVAAHVHDEIIVEGTYPVEEISRIMCDTPAWAEGLPVDGDGGNCLRYQKM